MIGCPRTALDNFMLTPSISRHNAHIEHIRRGDPPMSAAISTPMSSAATVARTAPLYQRVSRVIPPMEWPVFADDVEAILDLKRRRNAVILGHNYMTPEI